MSLDGQLKQQLLGFVSGMPVQMRGETSLLAAGKVQWVLPVSTFIPRYLVDMSKLFNSGRVTEKQQDLSRNVW